MPDKAIKIIAGDVFFNSGFFYQSTYWLFPMENRVSGIL